MWHGALLVAGKDGFVRNFVGDVRRWATHVELRHDEPHAALSSNAEFRSGHKI